MTLADIFLNTYDELIEKIISWAKASDDVKSVFIVGSRARVDHPADEYSDLDLFMVVTNPEYYISSTQWLKSISNYWMSFVEKTTIGGGKERRVLFENALDVDFAIFSEKGFEQIIENDEVQAVFKRGIRVLIDKSGLAKNLSPISEECQTSAPPSVSEFLNLVNDFWYHSVWTTKKLLRGELWIAKSCVDCYMKGLLLRSIEYHTHVIKGWNYDTWHDGRFLDVWAEQGVKERLQSVFAHYEKNDIAYAFLTMMDLFRLLAVEVAEKMGFEYPNDADESATDWVKKSLVSLVK